MSTTTESVADLKVARDAAEVALALRVVDWALEHELLGEGGISFGDTGIPLGDAGCPVLSEFDVYDLAEVLGLSSDGGCSYVGRVLELRYRLPRIWARVVALEVPLWKAFKVADRTMLLPMAGAGQVDRDLAHCLHSCSFAQIERSVEAAIIRFDPEEAERRRLEAAEHRHASVHLGDASSEGTVEITGCLDLDDALDLETALQTGAAALADAGCEESLDVRRAKALGDLARGQATLDLQPGGRALTLFVTGDSAVLQETGTNVLLEQVRQWCQRAGKVVLKPVIDLNTVITCHGYEPSPRLREQVILRDRTCVFPRCTRPARRCDLDHIQPWDTGGTTSSDNIACLCRRHHRAKTHSSWHYTMVETGLYEWISPSGRAITVDRRRRT